MERIDLLTTEDPDPDRAGEASDVKLGDRVAREIGRRISSGAWSSGDFIGTEADLLRSFGVSRSVFREAVAIAEWEGLIETRRGRDGGLYVAPPDGDAATSALRNFLFLTGATLENIISSRQIIDNFMFGLALQRMTPEEAEVLAGELLATHREDEDDRASILTLQADLNRMSRVAGLTGLGIFSRALRQVFVDRVRSGGVDEAAILVMSRRIANVRRRQMAAVASCDMSTLMRIQVETQESWLQVIGASSDSDMTDAEAVEHYMRTGQDSLIYEFMRPVKISEAVARAIVRKIARAGLQPGDRLGVESELMRELNVGRGGFREANRILERFGITETGRGKGGGLSVGRPRLDAVFAITRRSFSEDFLKRPGGYVSLMATIGREAARRAAQGATARLHDGPVVGAGTPVERYAALLKHVGAMTGDWVLSSFIDVMADAATVHPDRLVLLGSASRYDELFHKAVEAVRNGGDLLAPRYVFEMSRMLAPAAQTEKPG